MKPFVVSVLVFFTAALSAQVSGIVNYTQEQGLHASYTYILSQDQEGYIWIGSDNGLFRFDGVEFKNYSRKNGLRNIDVLQVVPMASGEVFIAPFMNGFAYLKNDSIYHLRNNPALKKLHADPAVRFILTWDSLKENLYLYNEVNPREFFVYNQGQVERKPLELDSGSFPLHYSIINYDFKDKLLLHGRMHESSGTELFQYDLRARKLLRLNIFIHKSSAVYYSSGRDFLAFVSGKESKEAQVFSGLFKPGKILTFSKTIYWLRKSGKDKIWVSFMDGGIAYYDLHHDPEMKAPVMLMEDYVMNDVLVDRDENIWFSTKDNGLFFIAKQSFNNYVRLPIKNNSSNVTGISANRTSIVLGYNMGNGSILKNNVLHDFVLDKHLKYANCLVIANDDTAVFGLGTKIYQLNLSNYTLKEPDFPGSFCKNLVSYGKTKILVCKGDYLMEYDFASGKFTCLLQEKTYSALPFDKDSLFVGSFKDLYKFNSATRRKTLFLSGYYFTDLKRIDSFNYIGATNGFGLILFNRKGITRRITIANGLANDQVKRVQVQNASTFWAATNSGLCRVYAEGDSLSVANFSRQDGLFSEKVSDCIIRRDTIYVATAKGLTILPIKSLLDQPKYIFKKVLINSMIIGNKTYVKPAWNHTATYPENNVSFHLSFLDYASQGKISYRYKIEGLNNYWQISNSSKILLNALPPGKYIFKVYGLGYNGKQSYTYTELPFEIKPRFWQTWWFQFCVIAILCLTALAIVNRIVQKRRNKKLKSAIYEKKIAELELQALKAQINPHFIYNCLNSIQFLLYKKNYVETENYLEVFARMIRKTLHYSEKTFMPIADEMEYLTLYLDMEKLRFKTRFQYKITAAPEVDLNWKIPSLLIQPFVENALKHGIDQLSDNKGFIEVMFDYTAPLLCITVKDNGIGIKNKLKTGNKLDSFGIRLSQKRIDTFKQLFQTEITFEINDLSESGRQGTEIKIYLNT